MVQSAPLTTRSRRAAIGGCGLLLGTLPRRTATGATTGTTAAARSAAGTAAG
ncbi:MAG: hypothetical protein JWN00_5858, partial [Actinomycetia bacterium]|nr:hypothetical protein [Actinomycetes bacterium]